MPATQVRKTRSTKRIARAPNHDRFADAESAARDEELDWVEPADDDADDADVRSLWDAAQAEDFGDRYN